jgi:hypothetical protein
MTTYIASLIERDAQLTDVAALVAGDYENLKPCLP